WYPWGEEAFEKAKKEDRPILLSIGYSTCHWCHVMEHESFEDEEVAELMNKSFISIKVDREERPDIDNIYMTVCQILSQGSCGWPLNVFMTPDKKPFYAATYIPKNSKYGRIGMMELVPRVDELWKNKREDLLKSANSVTETLAVATDPTRIQSSEELSKLTLQRGYEQLAGRYDSENGGFGNRPKFPTPHNLLFLLRYGQRTNNTQAINIVVNTLTSMSRGGIFDHIGFGFHRYSTDPEWLVPHFEKMLYDQALLAMAYTEAYQLTKNESFKITAERIFNYVLRDMTSPEGGFYSAEDADSEGEEGKFYLWKDEEIVNVLGKDEGGLILSVYNTSSEGNFVDEATGKKPGTNILHLNNDLKQVAKEMNIPEDVLNSRLEESRRKLFEVREKRIHPSKDDKIITDWNGLMIAALAKGGRVFGNEAYTDAAARSVDFINKNLYSDSRLLHRYRGGESGILANIDDYAFLIWGLIELYESTFDLNYLNQAIEYTGQMVTLFWDKDNLGFYFTPNDGEKLLVRQKEIYDGAVPSGNSVAMYDLIKLSRLTSNLEFENLSSELSAAFSSSLNKAPISHTMFMVALDFAVGPSYEIVISGDKNSDDTKTMIEKLRDNYIPNKVVVLKDKNSVELEKIAPYTKAQGEINSKATAYVCENFVCKLPTNDPDKMLELIKN
ncbi:MAG: thioredoxin domain-containing protein, partial [Thermodesulfobacteriota bacterium]